MIPPLAIGRGLPSIGKKSIKEIAKKMMGETEYAIAQLMSRPKINYTWKIEPEQRMCIEFADFLRVATINAKLKGVWFHVPNESKRHPIVAVILKAMGMIPGVYDYPFLWDTGSAVIEFKVAPNKPTDNQSFFGLWCDRERVPRFYCYSVEEAIAVLVKLGVHA